jgi:potassium-dependent mechanosensitive channel
MDYGITDLMQTLTGIWKFKLLTVAGASLGVGNLIIAGSLLLLTNRLAKVAVSVIEKRLIAPFVDDRASQVSYKTFAYYACLISFAALALLLAGIPLSVFTVLGGALAIGVGFGSQNIVNNFISGIILLVERPIKVGDIVEVDSVIGVVVSVGTRSTKIRNADNKVFIVPNSLFLERSVINWTHETRVLRNTLDFGVAYGSDVRKVENACMDLMLNHEGILQDPLPVVQFTNFADSSLNFQLIFFCDLNQIISLPQVRSDLRFKIDQKFRELEIEMAFPQRDMNLKLKDDLRVRVLS